MASQNKFEALVQDVTAQIMKVVTASVGTALRAASADASSSIKATDLFPARARREAKSETRRRPGRKPAAAPKAAKAKKPATGARSDGKSSPAEVQALGARIVALLAKSERHLSAKEVLTGLKLSLAEAGRFQYALNKVKDSGEVKQYGTRGGARYGAKR